MTIAMRKTPWILSSVIAIAALAITPAAAASASSADVHAHTVTFAINKVAQVTGVLVPFADGTCTTTANFSYQGKTFNLPVTASGSRNCALVQGNQSSAVARLQREISYNTGCSAGNTTSITADGIFGPATKAQLEATQTFLHITADGQYGNITAHAMYWLSTDGTTCNILP